MYLIKILKIYFKEGLRPIHLIKITPIPILFLRDQPARTRGALLTSLNPQIKEQEEKKSKEINSFDLQGVSATLHWMDSMLSFYSLSIKTFPKLRAFASWTKHKMASALAWRGMLVHFSPFGSLQCIQSTLVILINFSAFKNWKRQVWVETRLF